MRLLASYYWPGNIRELRNVLERALLLARGGPLKPADFSGLESQPVRDFPTDNILNLEEMENLHIKSVLDRFGGDTRKTAEILNISLATLYRKLKKISRD